MRARVCVCVSFQPSPTTVKRMALISHAPYIFTRVGRKSKFDIGSAIYSLTALVSEIVLNYSKSLVKKWTPCWMSIDQVHRSIFHDWISFLKVSMERQFQRIKFRLILRDKHFWIGYWCSSSMTQKWTFYLINRWHVNSQRHRCSPEVTSLPVIQRARVRFPV